MGELKPIEIKTWDNYNLLTIELGRYTLLTTKQLETKTQDVGCNSTNKFANGLGVERLIRKDNRTDLGEDRG